MDAKKREWVGIMLVTIGALSTAMGQSLPRVLSLSPDIGPVNTTVSIHGENFSPDPAGNIVRFGVARAVVLEASSTNLQVLVPTGSTPEALTVLVGGHVGSSPGPFRVTYTNGATITPSFFQPAFGLPIFTTAYAAIAGDLNGDGHPELVRMDPSRSKVLIQSHTGQTDPLTADSFSPRATLNAAEESSAMVMADLDGDGWLDLAVANRRSRTVSVFRNNGLAGPVSVNSFAPRIELPPRLQPEGLAVADLDGDGRLDLIVTGGISNSFGVFRNLAQPGSLTTGSFAPVVIVSAAGQPQAVVAADFDGDGRPDLALATPGRSDILLVRNSTVPGDGAAISFDPGVTLAAGGQPAGIAAGDLDGDGRPELLITLDADGAFAVMGNQANPGPFTANSFAPAVKFAIGGTPQAICLADMNGDGRLDVLIGDPRLNRVAVLENQSTTPGITGDTLRPPVDFPFFDPATVFVVDLNRDGRPDLVVASPSNGERSGLVEIRQTAVNNLLPPALVSGPGDRTVDYFSAVTWTSELVGGAPVRLQWQRNGIDLAGANQSVLFLPHVTQEHAGSYVMIATNRYGRATSSVARLVVAEPVVRSAPVGTNVMMGEPVTIAIDALGTEPLTYVWQHNGAVIAGATQARLTLPRAEPTDTGDYQVIVRSPLGSVTSAPVMVTINSDLPFLQPDHEVRALAVLADGSFIVGGDFNMVGPVPRGRLAKYAYDCSFDSVFDPKVDGSVLAAAAQTDGRIIIGGTFGTVGGQLRTNLARLLPDGTPDPSFTPWLTGTVRCIGVQSNGAVVVGGNFSNFLGRVRRHLGRIKPDGTVDTSFNPPAVSEVFSFVLEPEGRILVGTATRAYRLNSDGSQDTTFDGRRLSNSWVTVMRPDRKTLVGGPTGIQLVSITGVTDPSFLPRVNGSVESIALQANGQIVIGGQFNDVAGIPRLNLARLNPDGSLDGTFNPGASSAVHALALQADGRLLVAGQAGLVNGRQGRINRIDTGTESTQSLSVAGSTITWMRGGALPETLRPTMELSTNGATWTTAGVAQRITGGWRISNISLPANAVIRARIQPTSGQNGGSTGLIESRTGRPVLVSESGSRTNRHGTATQFAVFSPDAGPVTYQWYQDGVPLTDTLRRAGSDQSILQIRGLFGIDSGVYQAVVTGTGGSVTSGVMRLVVLDPWIDSVPTAHARQPGQSVAFGYAVGGTQPMAYRWWRDGAFLGETATPNLQLNGLQIADAGNYWLVASNAWGSTTSAVTMVIVNGITVAPPLDIYAEGMISSLAIQSGGEIVAGGSFRTLGGLPRTNLMRFQTNGSVDPTWNPTANNWIAALAIESGGSTIAAGNFTKIGDVERSSLARIDSSGSLDATFNPGADSPIRSLVVRSDDSLQLGGAFLAVGGQPAAYLARLDPAGLRINAPFPVPNAMVSALAMQPDGRLLIGGDFTTLDGQSHAFLGRLDRFGALEPGFTATADNNVRAFAIQPDGKILVGGYFGTMNGQPRSYLARLHSDGSLDPEFVTVTDNWVRSIVLQTDGRILIGGFFRTVAGQARDYVARLLPNGGLDPTFYIGCDAPVRALTIEPEGRILMAGAFATIGGAARSRIGRVNNTAPATQSLGYNGSTLTWWRGGASPEAWRVSFDRSADGIHWTALEDAVRIAGGWELRSVHLAASDSIRARAFIMGGEYNSSQWYAETVATVSTIACPAPHLSLTFTSANTGESPQLRLAVAGRAGCPYVLQSSGSPGTEASWEPLMRISPTNTVQEWLWTNTPDRAVFFRAVLE